MDKDKNLAVLDQQMELEMATDEPEEESWDAIFDENGDCLNPELMKEVKFINC